MTVEGFVEPHNGRFLTGWVWDSFEPVEPLTVEVCDGDKFYARVVADGYRADLLKAGKRDGRCLFEVMLPTIINKDLYVLVDHTGHRLNDSISGRMPLLLDWLDQDGVQWRDNLLMHRIFRNYTGKSATAEQLRDITVGARGNYSVAWLVRIVSSLVTNQKPFSTLDLVQELYRGILGRNGDPSGVEFITSKLEAGIPLKDVISDMMKSPEYMRNRIQDDGGNGKYLEGFSNSPLSKAMKSALTTLLLESHKM